MPPREAAAATRGGASHFKAVSSKLWERQGKNRGTTRFQAKCYGHIASGEFPEGHQRLTPAAPCSGAPAPPRCGGPQKWPMKSPDGLGFSCDHRTWPEPERHDEQTQRWRGGGRRGGWLQRKGESVGWGEGCEHSGYHVHRLTSSNGGSAYETVGMPNPSAYETVGMPNPSAYETVGMPNPSAYETSAVSARRG